MKQMKAQEVHQAQECEGDRPPVQDDHQQDQEVPDQDDREVKTQEGQETHDDQVQTEDDQDSADEEGQEVHRQGDPRRTPRSW